MEGLADINNLFFGEETKKEGILRGEGSLLKTNESDLPMSFKEWQWRAADAMLDGLRKQRGLAPIPVKKRQRDLEMYMEQKK